jgi:hypothetical protein
MFDIKVFVSNVSKMSDPRLYQEIFRIFFQNNPDLRNNIVDIQAVVFENPNDSPGIMRGLVWSPCHVVVTRRLVDAAMGYPRGAEALEILLAPGNIVRMGLETFCKLLEESSKWYPRLLSRMNYINFDVRTYLEARPYLWAEKTDCTTIKGELPGLGTDRIQGLIELTWEDFATAQKLEMGRGCLLLLLHSQPRISHAAIKMLISQWDVDVVKALLNFQKVEVTNEIIRCAAGNFRHGSKIMELLLSSENTEYGD